jgi:hypothetical protein
MVAPGPKGPGFLLYAGRGAFRTVVGALLMPRQWNAGDHKGRPYAIRATVSPEAQTLCLKL